VNWSTPETVAGFAASPPNAVLMQLAEAERQWNIISDELDTDLQAGFWKDELEVWKRVGLAP